MKPRKCIVDTTLRDGEQSPQVSFSRYQKLEILKILTRAGVEFIEAGVPSSSPYEKETICQIVEQKETAKISVWSRLNPSDVRHCMDCNPDIVHISIPVSSELIYTKLRKSKAWVVGQLHVCIELLKTQASTISIGFEDVFRSDISFLIMLTQTLIDLGISRIRLADTLGIATPSSCRNLIDVLTSRTVGSVQLGFHAHNDFGMALANTTEALKTRCDYADTTLFGIGERAGNCDFVKLIRLTESLFDWGLSAADAEYAQSEFCLHIGQPQSVSGEGYPTAEIARRSS